LPQHRSQGSSVEDPPSEIPASLNPESENLEERRPSPSKAARLDQQHKREHAEPAQSEDQGELARRNGSHIMDIDARAADDPWKPGAINSEKDPPDGNHRQRQKAGDQDRVPRIGEEKRFGFRMSDSWSFVVWNHGKAGKSIRQPVRIVSQPG
jgi:hypothetical protein